MVEAQELGPKGSSPEIPQTRYGAIVIPSYGMTKWEKPEGWDAQNPGREFNEYRLTFFGGVVCRAAAELVKDGVAREVIIGGAKIFPGDPKNDGNLMKDLLVRLGVPEGAIIQTRDATNTYNQLLHAKDEIKRRGIKGKVLTVHADMHKLRVPDLIRNYGIDSDTCAAEDILSEKYPAFKHVWEMIKNDPTYKEGVEAWETQLAELGEKEARLERKSKVIPTHAYAPRIAGWLAFHLMKKGADVPDVRHRKTVRGFAGSKAAA